MLKKGVLVILLISSLVVHNNIRSVDLQEANIPLTNSSTLQIPTNWTYNEIPIMITPKFISVEQVDNNPTINQSTINKYLRSKPLSESNLTLITPWGEIFDIYFDQFLVLEPKESSGQGELLLDFDLVWNFTEYQFNETSSQFEMEIIYLELIGKVEQNISWDFSPRNSSLKKIDWTFYDFNTGFDPNTAWRMVVTKNMVWWNSLKDYFGSQNRLRVSELDTMYYRLTPNNMWTEMVEFANEKRLTNWDSFTYFDPEETSCQSGHVNNVILDFGNFENTIIDASRTEGCANIITFLPDGFLELEEVLRKWFDRLQSSKSTYYVLVVSGLIVSLIVIYALKRSKKP